MAWREYADAQLRGVEETSRLMDSTWTRALAALLLWEAFFRDRVRRRLLVLPITADEHFDTSSRMPFARFRTELRRTVADFVNGASRDLVGLAVPSLGIPDLAPRASGVAGEAMRRAQEIADAAYRKARRLLERDRALAAERARVAAQPGAAPRPLDDLLPPAPQPDTGAAPTAAPAKARDAAAAVDVAEPAKERDAVAEDAADAVTDLLMNVWGNLGNEARRATEQMLGLVNRFGTRGRALAHLDAPRPGAPGTKGWYANRNIMRKSVVEHLRAMHRRRTLAAGTRDGHTHFRLDVPQDRFGKIDPQGALGRQLWRVRTLPEWEAEQARQNDQRNASSDFAGLGFGYGDVSFVTVVPREYWEDATNQGRALRAKWLGDQTQARRAARRG